MSDDKHVYLVEFMKFTGSNFHEGLALMKSMVKPFAEKINATVIATQICAMGSPMELLVVLRYNVPGYDDRINHAKNMQSEEMSKLAKEVGDKIGTTTLNFCKNVSGQPINVIDSKSRIVMRCYSYKGVGTQAVQKVKASLDATAKHLAPLGLRIAGVFAPVFSEHQNTIFTLIEVPEKVSLDIIDEIASKVMTDNEAMAKVASFYEVVTGVCCKAYMPLSD